MNDEYLARAKQKISDPEILAVVVSKRAAQLATQQARPMVKCDSCNWLDVALLEVAEGLLSYELPDKNAGKGGEANDSSTK